MNERGDASSLAIWFADDDRRVQLRELAVALRGLIAEMDRSAELAARRGPYAVALAEAERLQAEGFSPAEIAALGRAVPDLLYRFKEWEPPGERGPDGRWHEAEWFRAVEAKLAPALDAAAMLVQLGRY